MDKQADSNIAQTSCGAVREFSGVTHLCTKVTGHKGAHTSGDASWGAHNWTRRDPRWPTLGGDYEFCVVCGMVRRADDQNKPCSGKTPRLTLRDSPQSVDAVDPHVGSISE